MANEAGRAQDGNRVRDLTPTRNVILRVCIRITTRQSLLERSTGEGESPVHVAFIAIHPIIRHRVALLGSAAPSGRYEPSKAKHGRETDSAQVP